MGAKLTRRRHCCGSSRASWAAPSAPRDRQSPWKDSSQRLQAAERGEGEAEGACWGLGVLGTLSAAL